METTWYQEGQEWLLENLWVLEIAFVVIALLLINLFLKKVILKSNKETDLEHALVLPARVLLWILLISFGLDLIARKLTLGGMFLSINSIRNVGIVVCLSWFLLRWKKAIHTALSRRREIGKMSLDAVSVEVLAKIYTILILFVSLLIIMQLFGLDIAPLIAFGGIGAAALGFASKEVIANFFGGLMLYAIRPFSPGDLVEVPEKHIYGSVEEIGWYSTTIRDLQKKPIYVPNSIFSTEILVNLSRMTHRRLEEVIEIRATDTDKVLPIVEAIRQRLKIQTQIDQHLPQYVFFKGYGTHSLYLEIQAYILATRYEEFMEIKQKLLLEIGSIIEQCGAEMPYPTTEVHILSQHS